MNNKERTLSRENIDKILYKNEISQNNIPNIVRTFIEKRKFDDIYFKEILTLLDKNMSIIDNLIYKNGNVAEFDASIIDKSILRLSVCEFLFRKDIPKKVIMNEGIKIAKKFSSEKSFKFINKILENLLVN